MMRPKLLLMAIALVITQTGCMWRPLPWAGAVAIPDPFGMPYPRLPALSPDGKHVAILGSLEWDDNRGHIAIWDIENQQGWSVIDREKDSEFFFELDWDSSSTQLLYDGAGGLVFHTPATGDATFVSVPESGSTLAIFGPGEGQYTRYILVPKNSDPNMVDRVSIFDLGEGGEDQLFPLDRGRPNAYQGMDWSPDGTRLLVSFVGDDSKSGSYDIFLYDQTTQEFGPLIASSEDESQPHWSSDGQWFVYLVSDFGETGSALVFSSADATCLIREPVDSLLMDVDWGPGNQLAVVYANQLYLVDIQQAFGFGLDDISNHCSS